ncbi:Uncharacterized protein dnm_042720 [Desulfonema magnum]|uniref:Uncharacterized protein n=1 Tax=Desulfonema magnum TaxID=45655 RepID=A0A975GNX3_9BACT|nr:Uncharacterized protein dnm_042720 [Desulfonema magnum]
MYKRQIPARFRGIVPLNPKYSVLLPWPDSGSSDIKFCKIKIRDSLSGSPKRHYNQKNLVVLHKQ